MQDICEVLGVNRSSFYYQSKEAPSEAVLLAEIEKLAGAYPRYGYRRITRVYNEKRPHSALAYLTPKEFQRKTLS